MSAARRIAAAIAARPGRWLAWTLGLALLQPAILLAAAILHLGSWPNYALTYPYADNVARILARTPSWRDALAIILDEPLAELGHRIPAYGISEWTLTLQPPQALALLTLSALAATLAVLPRARCRRPTALLGGLGLAAGGLTQATVSWVVCCGSPTWVVALALLGVGTATAMALEPAGPWLGGGATGLLLTALWWRAR